MDLFSGLMKGLKPIMDASGVEQDESMQLAVLQGEVMELEGKKCNALAELGQRAYDFAKSNTWNSEQLLPLCTAVDDAEMQLKNKRIELEKMQKAADDKKREEEEKAAARTCPDCGEVNPEGTNFCQNCGSRLGVKKPSGNVCKSCGAVNGPDTRFCGECGAKLEASAPSEIRCPNCGASNQPGTRFCGECGTRL
jgi:uncharacterized OB-fold protein